MHCMHYVWGTRSNRDPTVLMIWFPCCPIFLMLPHNIDIITFIQCSFLVSPATHTRLTYCFCLKKVLRSCLLLNRTVRKTGGGGGLKLTSLNVRPGANHSTGWGYYTHNYMKSETRGRSAFLLTHTHTVVVMFAAVEARKSLTWGFEQQTPLKTRLVLTMFVGV